MSRFSDRLARAKADLGVSTRAAADRAKANGHRLSANTVSLYTRDGHPDPDSETVAALAYALRVPLDELRQLAGLPDDLGEFRPDASANLLTRQQRNAVNEVIRLFAAGNTGAGESNGSPMNDAGGKPATEEAQLASELVADKRRQREDVNAAGDNVHPFPETPYFTSPPPAEKTAALETENRGRKLRDEQDEVEDESQDPEDWK